jgi:response regulator RpfG family c-di-GMP phosphodiesterase
MNEATFNDIRAAFRAEVLHSEQRRIAWFLAGLVVIFLFAAARSISFFWGQRVLATGIPVFVAAVLYAVLQLRIVRRALRTQQAAPRWIWPTSAVVEALLPSIMLFALASLETVGPHRALVYPAVCIYFIAISLSTLHLRPRLSYLSGLVSAAGYLAVTAYVYLDTPPTPDQLHVSVCATYAVMMIVAAAAAGGVAGQLRRQVIVALEQAETRRRSEIQSRNTLIFGLAKLAEYRDSDTGRHLERMAEYCTLLATALRESHPEITAEWVEQLPVAATLHDIGKVGLPDNVLKKPGPLTPAERLTMQAHSALGAEALRSIRRRGGGDPLLGLSEHIAAAHHERWDGSGYPGGLHDGDIALAARIVAVADVYDALTSARVYKPALAHAAAAELVRSGRGTHFDPAVVDAFERQAGQFAVVCERYKEHDQPAAPVDRAHAHGRADGV